MQVGDARAGAQRDACATKMSNGQDRIERTDASQWVRPFNTLLSVVLLHARLFALHNNVMCKDRHDCTTKDNESLTFASILPCESNCAALAYPVDKQIALLVF